MLRTLLLALLLVLAACGTDPADAPTDGATQATPPTPEFATPDLVDGVQVVAIEAGQTGYRPSAVELAANVPARLVVTRTVDSECSSQLTIPAFDVPRTDLPLHTPVAIEFTPDEAGTFEFVCGMDMQRGSLLVQS